MGGCGVLADANDYGIDGLELLIRSGKGAGLAGATGGIVPGIKIQDGLFSGKVRQRYAFCLMSRIRW